MKYSSNISTVRRVLRTVWLNEGISRIEIAGKLGMDKSTITNTVSGLIDQGIISEIEESDSGPQGGRKRIKLKIRSRCSAVMGIEVQPEYCNVCCINPAGEILIYRRFPADITAFSFSDVFPGIVGDIRTELDELKIPLSGIGLGLSGIVNPEKGVICESIPLGVTEEYAILDELSSMVDVPVFIDNDGNCCSWGELIFNKSEDLQDFIYCLVEFREHNFMKSEYGGIAVGMGVVIGGRVHYGRNNSAGEFRSVFAEHDQHRQFSIDRNKEFEVKNDPLLFKRFSVELSKNIALMVNTFAMSDCFIGGDLQACGDSFTAVLKNEIRHNWNYPGEPLCRVRSSSLGEKAVAYGAAAMIVDRMFSIPGPEEKTGILFGVQ